MKTKETFLHFEVDIPEQNDYITSEAGKECTVREGTGLWTYGLTLNYLPKQKWFNTKLPSPEWFNIKLPASNGLILNRPVEMV